MVVVVSVAAGESGYPMKRSVKIVAAMSLVLGILAALARWLQSRDPDPFENAYATVSALAIVGFLLAWAYVALSLVVLWWIGERIRDPWLYVWTTLSGAFVVWVLGGLFQFLFP